MEHSVVFHIKMDKKQVSELSNLPLENDSDLESNSELNL